MIISTKFEHPTIAQLLGKRTFVSKKVKWEKMAAEVREGNAIDIEIGY